jgi:uncharacterized protein (TIGR00290 family)
LERTKKAGPDPKGKKQDLTPRKLIRMRALVAWSSGKDSAWALAEVRRDPGIEVVGLLTTITSDYARVSMHGVREEVLEAQARAAGLPLRRVAIPAGCVNADYERAMGEAMRRAREDGVTHVVFGDLFLADVRAYRERMLAGSGIAPLFPLWGRNTAKLARKMIGEGLAATVVCVDPRHLAESFAGRAFDATFLADLPPNVDPCGENGEFHTCVTDGPMFAAPLAVRAGQVVQREGFVFADLLPRQTPDLVTR